MPEMKAGPPDLWQYLEEKRDKARASREKLREKERQYGADHYVVLIWSLDYPAGLADPNTPPIYLNRWSPTCFSRSYRSRKTAVKQALKQLDYYVFINTYLHEMPEERDRRLAEWRRNIRNVGKTDIVMPHTSSEDYGAHHIHICIKRIRRKGQL
jgi:hypothetical protein